MVRIDSPEVQDFEKAHLSVLRALAPECMVLLKKNGDFPLSAPCKIALYGAGAVFPVKGGTGSGDVNSRETVNLWDGMKAAGFDTVRIRMRGRFFNVFVSEGQQERIYPPSMTVTVPVIWAAAGDAR